MLIKRRLTALLLIVFLCSGCAHYIVHPGAVNTFDSQTYDALIGAKTTIDTARAQINAGSLPRTVIPAFNALVKAYDAAYPVYKTYHEAVAAGKVADAYLTSLNADMVELSKALTAFKGAK